jgi:hypothetical protein
MSSEDDRHVWTDADHERLERRSWLCPRRVIDDGTWARLWRDGRSNGAATSILPVLALHSWPEGRGKGEWSRWTFIGRRRLAGLAGVDAKTATAGLSELQAAGLLESKREPQPGGRGGYRTQVRLHARLYARKGEESGRIHGMLVGGGTWAMLPTPAARHLYVIIAAMDAIGDEAAYCNAILEDCDTGNAPWLELWEETEGDEDEMRRRWLDRERARWPMSISQLERWSGTSRRGVINTIPLLLAPVFDRRTLPLVRRGDCVGGHWYAPNRTAFGWYWRTDLLNDRERIRRARAELWPTLASRGPSWRWAPCVSSRTWHQWNGSGRSRCGHGRSPGPTHRGQEPPKGRLCKLCRFRVVQ